MISTNLLNFYLVLPYPIDKYIKIKSLVVIVG